MNPKQIWNEAKPFKFIELDGLCKVKIISWSMSWLHKFKRFKVWYKRFITTEDKKYVHGYNIIGEKPPCWFFDVAGNDLNYMLVPFYDKLRKISKGKFIGKFYFKKFGIKFFAGYFDLTKVEESNSFEKLYAEAKKDPRYYEEKAKLQDEIGE